MAHAADSNFVVHILHRKYIHMMMIADVDIIVSAYKMMFTWLLEIVYYTEDADMITRQRSHLSAAVLAILHQHRELEIILRLRLNPAFVLKI